MAQNQKNNIQQMIINYVPGEECRVAMVEQGRLEEFHDERTNAVTIVGNVYVGKVMNVEASIQAAFVDFGHGANGFLHVSDLHPQYFPGEDEETKERIGKKTPRRDRPPIQHCLKRGQEIIVQVLKEGISTKGPTLTTYLSIPGRYLVMLPQMDRVGVSRKVEDEEQRKAMRQILDGLELPEDFGFIVRTAGIGKAKTDLKRDLAYLQRLWKDIERRRRKGKGPRLLYAESDLLMRALRDYWTSEIDEIIIDDESALKRAGRFMKIVSPRSSTKLLNYDRSTPIFHTFGIEEQIHRMHERVVPLPSGGSLIIDETEALVAIDVNSGKMRHHGDAETTAYQTNLEAVDEICRQLRLRDVGGLIVCDLIDMMKRSNRRTVETLFRDRLKRDRAATKPLPISQFGIVEMTRQRMRGSLRSTHYTKCPTCTGRGVLRRPASLASDALREMAALLGQEKVAKVEMVVSPRLAGELLSAKRLSLTRLEFRSQKKLDVRVSEDIPVDQLRFYAYDEAGADVAIDRLPKPTSPRDLEEWVETSPGNDWAVDTLAEQDEIEMAVATPEATSEMDDFLSGAGDDDEAGSTEEQRDESDQKKPRRRRRRRRKGGAKEGERQGEPATPSDDTTEEDARDGRQHGEHKPEGEAEGEGDGRPRKRRRRRRGGRSRRAGEPAGAESRGDAPGDTGDGSAEPSDRDHAPTRTEPADRPREPQPAGGRTGQLRGDSWDVTPAELAASNGNAAAAAPEPMRAEPETASEPAEAHPESDDAPRDRKPGRRRSRKKRSSKAQPAGEEVQSPSTPHAAASETPEPEPPKAEATEDAAPAPKAGPKKKRGKRSRKKAATPATESAPSEQKKEKAEPAPKASAQESKASEKAAPPPDKLKKPSRPLYGAQRKRPAPSARTARDE